MVDAPYVGQTDYLSDRAAYRQDLRGYLAEQSWVRRARSAVFDSSEESMTHDASVLSRLYDAGWNRYGWPEQAGGLGGNELHRAIYYEELSAAMVPIPAQCWTLEVLGPAMLKFAPQLAAEYLPQYLRGAEWWAQGFSEPEAGSDLAALRTRAGHDGVGGFVINGQKIWSSQAPTASRLLVLARTGAPDSRHRGLTMFLVDADTPGITIRPITLASGRRELAEVFFDDVRVPPERVVGELNSGWAVTMFLMQYERGMYGYGVTTKLLTLLSRLRETMMRNGCRAADRERLAHVYVSVLSAQARSARSVRKLAHGGTLGPESSIDKLLFTRAEQQVSDLILDLQRRQMLTGQEDGTPSGTPAEIATARAEWWYSRAATIMGGTVEIQRGIVADHILGLPKEVRT